MERAAIVDCLEKSGWNVEQSARRAGYSRAQFYRLMQKHAISRPTQWSKPRRTETRVRFH